MDRGSKHDPIKIATLKSIIEDAGISIENFLELL